mgnify:CR=1 FL=1
MSATPGPYELKRAAGNVVEQIIRPTGLMDPVIEVRKTEGQIDDLIGEIHHGANVRGHEGHAVADAERVRHDRQRGVHGRRRREEPAVDDVEVVDVVRPAVDVEHRGPRIGAEAAGAVLMRHAALILIGVVVLTLRVAGAADLTPAEAAAGKRLYVNKCARCHRFYDPAAYDDMAWNGWMVKMKQKKMSHAVY